MPARVVALGASNLTRGLQTVVAAARDAYGADVEVVAALGHGRSYGADSTFLVRTLPGILHSEIWSALDALPDLSTRAIVSDVGNDILYGYSPPQILSWVEETITRLQRHASEIVVAGLPHARVRAISNAKFLVMRSLLFPRSRLTLDGAASAAAEVEAGLVSIARSRGLRFVPMKAEWYGFDPIHIRPSLWQPVWREIVAGDRLIERHRLSRLEAVRLYAMRPARQRVLGIEQVTPQIGQRLPLGGRVWLF